MLELLGPWALLVVVALAAWGVWRFEQNRCARFEDEDARSLQREFDFDQSQPWDPGAGAPIDEPWMDDQDHDGYEDELDLEDDLGSLGSLDAERSPDAPIGPDDCDEFIESLARRVRRLD